MKANLAISKKTNHLRRSLLAMACAFSVILLGFAGSGKVDLNPYEVPDESSLIRGE